MTSKQTWNWVDEIAYRLIHGAARRAPESLSERLEEEWLADLSIQRGALARLRFAIGCCWATNVIAHEFVATAVPSACPSMEHGTFVRYPKVEFPFFSARTMTFMLVAFLHAAVLYGLLMGLGIKFTKITEDPLVNRFIKTPPQMNVLLPQRPQVSITRIELPRQEIMPAIESDPEDSVLANPSEPLQPAPSPPIRRVVDRMQGGPGIGFPSTNDFYPDASIRMGEKGVATVEACVDGKGRLISQPTIVESTGSKRLDESSVKLAEAGSGHYRATTEDGRPVNSCYPFRIRFELRN
jgi:TonB family protein